MRIVVDLNRCLGCAQCGPLAPEVLKLNGEEALTYDPNPDDSQRVCGELPIFHGDPRWGR